MPTYSVSIPVTPIDLINRRAAATGSLRMAALSAHGDYNGHHVTIDYRAHAIGGARWVCEYFWAGRVVLGRGSLADCIEAGRRELERGAWGTVVAIHASEGEGAPEPIDEQIAQALAFGATLETEPRRDARGMPVVVRPSWWSVHHDAVIDALSWAQLDPGIVGLAANFKGETIEDWNWERDTYLEQRRAERRGGRTA